MDLMSTHQKEFMFYQLVCSVGFDYSSLDIMVYTLGGAIDQESRNLGHMFMTLTSASVMESFIFE